MINELTRQFILKHRNDDVNKLALKAKNDGTINMQQAITQIAAWQIAKKKLPSWAEMDNIVYPQHLSMEQCSSEATARYKSTLVQGDTLVDLTAGLGVDISFMATRFHEAHYVEQQKELSDIAAHNFYVMGLRNVTVHNMTAEEFLETMPHVSCIFIDPSRRDANGAKTVRIADCQPDIVKLMPRMKEKADTVIVKLSPMLDITAAINDLKIAQEVHIVAVDNECKELLIVIKSHQKPVDTTIKCVNLNSKLPTFNSPVGAPLVCAHNNSQLSTFKYQLSTEQTATCQFADKLETYLYEPNASVMKAAPYKLLSQTFNIKKLHPNSHLYTSDTLVSFPGRTFSVTDVSTFSKRDIKIFLVGTERANIAVRNFPSSPDELRKRLKLKDGGDTYIFATTLCNGVKILIKAKKLSD